MEESAAIIPRSRVRNIAIPKIPTMIANEFGSAEDRQSKHKLIRKKTRNPVKSCNWHS